MEEIWMPVKGYEGLYEVSDCGKVRSMKFGKVKELSPTDNGTGYLRVLLRKEGKRKMFLVHRLVVQAFIGKIPKGLVVNHKDENPSNNSIDNLEIVTQKYNSNYGSRNERISVSHKGKKHSEESRAKMSAAKKGKSWSQARRDAQNKKGTV